ncbi:MAG: sugar porter family MFS transporter [Verrucomicrobia bacterium]|nr:sugar porter family MFS transporter [Verrucomicrobiota bacterium]
MNASNSGRQPYLVCLIATVAAVGGFLFGYDLSIISGVMLFLKPEFGLTPNQVGLAMGSALLGCMAGPLLSGTLSDRWGRKPTLIFAGLLFAAGAIGSALPANVLYFDLFRFLGGVGVGLASVVSPMFIAEVSPPRIRGALVTVNQLAIVVGLTCAVIVSYFLSFGEHWRWMLASNAVPVPIFIIGLLCVPESPRWMAQRNRSQEALAVLTMIDGRENAEGEMRDILAMSGEKGMWRELFRPGMRFAMLIACSLAVFQQITGASILTMYMPTVFQEAGFNAPSDAIFQNVLMSLWYVLCTIVALVCVDRLGRKPLLLLGTMGMAVGMTILGLLFHWHTTGIYVVLTLFLVMGAYLVSLAPLTWLIMSEIFPNRLRGKAMAVASVCVWTASFLTAKFFPPMIDFFKNLYGTPAMAFWIYAMVSAVAFLFSWFVIPETKGRTLEEIGASWNITSKHTQSILK